MKQLSDAPDETQVIGMWPQRRPGDDLVAIEVEGDELIMGTPAQHRERIAAHMRALVEAERSMQTFREQAVDRTASIARGAEAEL